MGEQTIHHFHDFGISGRVHDSQNQLFSFFWKHQDTLNDPRTISKSFFKIWLEMSKLWKSTILKISENIEADKSRRSV